MAKGDMAPVHWHDIPAAAGLLTRVPVRVNTALAMQRGARAAWAYPIVGLKIAIALAALGYVALWVGVSPAITAALLITLSASLTGAMHEDGLADSADGLWGGWTREKRLAIMKDSRTGAYGVLALILSILIRWTALTTILVTDHWTAALICIGMLSRAAMVAVMTGLPQARDTGLSQSVGRPTPLTAWLAIGVAVFGSTIALGLTAATLLIIAGLITSIWAGIAHQKIGGQTGDILGATQQLTEIALLITLATII